MASVRVFHWKEFPYEYNKGRMMFDQPFVAIAECHSCCWWKALGPTIHQHLKSNAHEALALTSI